MTRWLSHLAAFAVLVIWVMADIPGVWALSASAVLASGALLGALAIVFQGLLRDFAAGLVVLFDDRHAIGGGVDLGGLSGEVVDLDVLRTELRSADSRVMTVPNSRCEPMVNRTRLFSGAELRLPLAPRRPRSPSGAGGGAPGSGSHRRRLRLADLVAPAAPGTGGE